MRFFDILFALISNNFSNLSIAQQVRQRMSISLVDHWPFGVSQGNADEIVVRLAFLFSFKARNRGANSEPFKVDYNEALHENTSKIMLCDSTSVPLAFPCMPPQ